MNAPRIPPAAVYEPVVAVEGLPADLRLRSLEWGVLFAVTGRHTVAQIGRHLGLAPAQRDGAFTRLLDLGLLAERLLSAGEYLRAAATVDGEEVTLAGFLRAGLAGPVIHPVAEPVHDPILEPAPEPVTEDAAPIPSAPASDPPFPRGERAGEWGMGSDLGGFEPLALPDEEILMEIPDLPVPTVPPALSLRAVMRFVSEQSRDADAGQLDIYRAFVRVSPQLLRRNGITTLRFEDDRLLTDPDLQEALLASVEHVVGRSCPPEVFVRS